MKKKDSKALVFLHVNLRAEQVEFLKLLKAKEGVNPSQLIRIAVEEKIEKIKEEGMFGL